MPYVGHLISIDRITLSSSHMIFVSVLGMGGNNAIQSKVRGCSS